MTRTGYTGPRYPDPKAVAGLRQRLEEREIKFLPVKRVRWVKDVKR